MNVELKVVHIGDAIDKRRMKLGMSKSELARRIGLSQQHIGRVLKKDNIDTKQLIDVCVALDYNFFTLYCTVPPQISAYLAAVALQGDANNMIGDAQMAAELAKAKEKIESLQEKIDTMKEMNLILKGQIKMMTNYLKDKGDAIVSENKDMK